MTKPILNKALTVGALAALALSAFLVAFTFFKKGGYSESDSYLVTAFFTDATGLTWKSRVQIAGIQVGEVSKITLVGDRARLDMRIKKDIDLRKDACLTKSFPSALLPDAQLEAVPGTAGQPLLRDLPEGQREITCVREASSVQKLMESLAGIATDVKLVTGDLAKTVGGPKGSMREIVENLVSLTRRLDATVAANEGHLNAILANADVVSADLRELTQTQKARIKVIVANVEDVTGQLKQVARSLQEVLDGVGAKPGAVAGGAGPAGPGGAGAVAGGAPGEATAQARGVREAVEKINSNLARLDDLLAKLQEGKSVGGRLIGDEKMGRQLASAVDSVANYVERLEQLRIEVSLRSEWLLNQKGAKSYFGLKILPRPDKYYILEIVADPRGVDTVTTETIPSRDPITGVDTTTVSTKTLHEQKLTYTLQLAKRYGPVAFRGGIIESSGGAGSDLYLFDDALQLSMSVYQFSRPYSNVYPRAKIWVNLQFLQHFHLTAGADDFLNQWRQGRYPGGPKFTLGNDVFFGAALFFTDDDLKTLLGSGAGTTAATVGTTR